MPLRIRQNRSCRVSKIQVLWHDSNVMRFMPRACSVTLNRASEVPDRELGISLRCDDAYLTRAAPLSRCRSGGDDRLEVLHDGEGVVEVVECGAPFLVR